VVPPGLPVAAKGDGMANPRMIWLLAAVLFSSPALPIGTELAAAHPGAKKR